jgi:hypothetical protein
LNQFLMSFTNQLLKIHSDFSLVPHRILNSQFHCFNAHWRLLRNHPEVSSLTCSDFMQINQRTLLLVRNIVSSEKLFMDCHGSTLSWLNAKSSRLLVGTSPTLSTILTTRSARIRLPTTVVA